MEDFTLLISMRSWSPGRGRRLLSLLRGLKKIKSGLLIGIFLFSGFYTNLLAQADTPCEATHRWEKGSTWKTDGSINDSPNAPEPNGIIRCGSSAETQSNISPFNNSVYNSAEFLIDVESDGGCVNPSNGLTASPKNPTNNKPIIWLNFDVRPYSGSFEVQINDNDSQDDIAWALYVSDTHTDGVSNNPASGDVLSGDCSNLNLQLVSCGVESSSTWNTIPIRNVDFLEPTNFYIAIWDQKGDNSVDVNNFKARFGCGDSDTPICNLVVEEETVSCLDSDTYQVIVPVIGANAQFTATDPNANSISADLCLTNIGQTTPVIEGSFTLTYNIGTDYNISINAVKPSTNGCANPFNPTQCVGSASGSSPIPPTVSIPDQIVCADVTSVDLTALEPGAQSGGMWSNAGGDIADATDVDPNDGPFTYTIGDNINCQGTDGVAYTFYDLPVIEIADQQVCEDVTSVDLTALEPGAQSGGTWSNAGGDIADATDVDPNDGPFTYTYTDGNGCTGTDGVAYTFYDLPVIEIADQQVCEDVTSVDLTALEPGAQSGGTWSNAGGDIADATDVDPNDGPFTYTYTDSSGCTGTDGVAYTFYDLPVIEIADQQVCEDVTSVDLTALEPGAQSGGTWSNAGGDIADATDVDPNNGPFTYTYTDGNGCTGTDGVAYTFYDLPVIEIADQQVCEDVTSVDLTALEPGAQSGGTWSNAGGDIADATDVDPNDGPFTYTYTDSSGCTGTDGVAYTFYDLPVIEIADQQVCEDVTSVDLTALEPGAQSGGTWSNAGGDIADATDVDPNNGPFTYTYTDGNGCTGTDGVAYTFYDLPVIEIADQQVCEDVTSVDLTALEPGAQSGGTWSNAGGDIADATDVDPNNGPFTYTYTDGNGCTGTDGVAYTFYDLPVIEIADQQVCEDVTSVDLTALEPGAQSGGTWSNAGGDIADATDVDPNDGPFTYTYTDSSGCTGTDGVAYTFYDLPVIEIADQQVCEDVTSVDLTALEPGAQSGGTWSNAGGDIADATDVDPNDGPFTYTYTDGNGCTGTDGVAYTFYDLPVIEIADQQVCEDVTSVDLTALEPGAQSGGTWSNAGGDIADATDVDPNNGPFTYTYTDGNGCTGTDGVAYTFYDLPVIEIADQQVCEDVTSVDLTALEPGAQSGGTWSNAGGDIADATDVDPNNGPFTYTYTDGNGCTGTDGVAYTFYDLPVIEIADQQVCEDVTSVDLTALEPGAQSGGTWSNAGGDIADATDVDPNNGPFTYTYTDGNGCTGTDGVAYTFYDLPVIEIADQQVCEDVTSVDLTALEPGAQSGGTWSNAGGDIADATDVDPNDGPFTYTYTDSSGCTGTDGVAYTFYDLPVIEIADQQVCEDVTSVDLTALEPGAQSGGTWSNAGGDIADATDVDPNNGPFTYTYTDGNGCTGTDGVAYTFYDLPVIEIADQQVCEDVTSVDLTALEPGAQSGGTWSNAGGDIADATDVDPNNGPFIYTYTDGNGCTGTDGVAYTFYDLPVIEIADQQVCEDVTSVDLTALEPGAQSGGTWSNAGGDIADATDVDPNNGPFIYTYTDGNGCTGTDGVAYTFYDLPVIEIADQQVCEDVTSVDLTALEPGAQSGGTWSNAGGDIAGATDVDPNDGPFTYTYTDGNSCTGTDGVAYVLIPLPETPDTQIIQADCLPGSKGSVALSYLDPDITQFYYRYKLDEAGDDTWSIWTLYTGAIALDQADYDFEVKYTEDGCVSEDFPITIDRPLDVVLTLEPSVTPVICETGLGSIEILNAAVLGLDKMNYTVFNQANPGVPLASYDYVKYPAGGFSLAPGIYLITAVSNNGCEFGSTIQTLVEPICQEFEGCTLGYWKNHTNRWECYSTCTLYSEVFGGEGVTVPSALQGKTLLEVLNLGGGGVYNLGRQSVAALLNTCHGDIFYEILTPADLIAYVQSNFNNAGAAGSYLDMLNNAGCTLGGTKATTAPSDSCPAEEASKPGKGKPGNKSALTSGFKASPVPFKDKLSIQYDFDYVSDVNIQVYDLSGQLLKTYKDKKVTKGDVKDLGIDFRMKANQIYILRVQTNREVFTQNIISAKR